MCMYCDNKPNKVEAIKKEIAEARQVSNLGVEELCEKLNNILDETEHFACDICGEGMCDECYDLDVEHDLHYNRPLDLCDDEKQFELITKACGGEPEYLCEKCLGKIMEKKETYSIYAIGNDGSTENIESGLTRSQAKKIKDKLTQQLKDGVYINTTTSLDIVTEFDFDEL